LLLGADRPDDALLIRRALEEAHVKQDPVPLPDIVKPTDHRTLVEAIKIIQDDGSLSPLPARRT
jgi:hypothetical protein